MQNKGAIITFAIALALVSLYQLSFSWITAGVKNDAKEFAKGDPNKELYYLDSVKTKPVYNFLWIRPFTLRECQERELNLGLDLKGGMNVTLEVSVPDLIINMANNSKDPVFVESIKKAKLMQKASQEDFVTLFGKAWQEVAPTAKMASVFATLELKEKVTYNTSNEDVLKVIREETQAAITNSFNILRTRIDHFGVAQPNIQQLENTGRILVELPGVKDPARVRKLLQGTANLEFWETYFNEEVFEFLKTANDRIKLINEGKDTDKKDTTIVADTLSEANANAVKDSTKTDTTKNTELAILDEIKKDSAAVLSENANLYKKNNPLFAILNPNVNAQNQLEHSAAVGIAELKDTSKVNAYLRMTKIAEIFPRDLKLLWEVKPFITNDNGEYFRLVAIKVKDRDGKPALSGDVIVDANADFAQNKATSVVNMSMNGEGAKIWARLTKDNVNRQIAIVLDNFVYSFPNVNGEITGGRSEISGNFTINEAQDLANVLKSGKLDAPAKIIEEEIVGPSLGQEAINSGLLSFIIAFIFVMLYMIFYYRTAGLIANLALLSNLFFIFGVLASLGAVLTLPGIAGIVLTIGMSVDANVLIFERIREELGNGKGIRLAIADGYKNAYSAIIDGNVTTLLTGIVLYIFGHGPIKGFATTLIIGILTSLFSAIFITRIVFDNMLKKEKPIRFASKFTESLLKNTNIDFLGKRKIAYFISGTLILLSIISLGVRGLNQGVDFKGGRTYVIRFQNPVTTVEIASALSKTLKTSPEVKTFGQEGMKITTAYLIDKEGEGVDNEVDKAIYDGLKPIIGDKVTFEQFMGEYRMSSQKVGPSVADDIRIAAVYAIIFSLIIMFMYIFIRFSNWQFGLGGIAALVHDVTIVLGVFSALYGILPFNLEIDQAFIAAILTVIGYSINDTVIVFDRIREFVANHKRGEAKAIYNLALNSTLSRTINTSLTTIVVLLAIFIFGGEVIRGFIFAMLIGILVGTYSSLYVATPITFDAMAKINKKKELEETELQKKKKKA
jgi:SecD/SecF fusion protein